MTYQTLYLRWRPSDFNTLVGQVPVKQALMNALTSGRIAHAYLFTGPRGTGKTTTARIFAKALNCEKGPSAHPCGQCLNCRQITEGSSMDVQELDAASNRGVDDIKNLNKNADFAPVNCRYKVYIIDEAHMLTTEACNALLKTLEEPPLHVVFILATTEPQKILPTIHSRCQRFDFHPITPGEITAHLRKVAEGSDIRVENEALELIAAASEGGMRDALSLLEQCGVMTDIVTAETVRSVRGIIGRETLRELVEALGRRTVATALEIFDRLMQQGKDIRQILTELSEYMRALLLYKAAPSYQAVYVTDTAEGLERLAVYFGGERLLAAQEIIHQAMNELRFTARGRITAEMCLYDLCREDDRTLKVLAARVERLEQEVERLQNDRRVAQNTAAPQSTPTLSQKEESLTEEAEQRPGEMHPVASSLSQSISLADSAASDSDFEKSSATIQTVWNSSALNDGSPGQTAYTPYGGEWAEGDEYWTKAMEILRAERKNAIASCAANAAVLAYENKVLTLGFKMKFLCDRLAKADYREVVEEILLRVARTTIHLQCVVDTGNTAASRKKKGLGKKIETWPAGTPILEDSPAKRKPSVKKTIDAEETMPESQKEGHGAPAQRSSAVPEHNEKHKTVPEKPAVAESTRKAMEMFGAALHKL